MNENSAKKEVTLEAIKLIVEDSVARSVTKLATKEELTALREGVGDIRMKLNSHIIDTNNRFDGLTLSMDDLPT